MKRIQVSAADRRAREKSERDWRRQQAIAPARQMELAQTNAADEKWSPQDFEVQP